MLCSFPAFNLISAKYKQNKCLELPKITALSINMSKHEDAALQQNQVFFLIYATNFKWRGGHNYNKYSLELLNLHW